MNESRFDARRVGLGLRPPRVAVLIGADCTWAHCISLIGTLTQIWGGVAYALIPTDGQTISRVFWRLLKRYDPDWIARYADTVNVSDKLWGELSDRLCLAPPMGQQPHAIWPNIIGWPLTLAHQCLPDNEALAPVLDLKIRGDPILQTLVYASAGYLHEEERSGLEQNGVEIVDQEIDVASRTAGLYQLASDLWVARQRGRDVYLPLFLSLRHLGPYSTGIPNRYPIVATCGDTLDDFALFWTLRALRGTFVSAAVFWIPRLYRKGQAGDGASRALWPYLAQAIVDQLQQVWGDRRMLATSLSLPDSSLDSLGSALEEGALVRLPNQQVRSATVNPADLDQLLPYDTYYWEMNNVPDVNMSVVQFLDGQGLAILNTPTPKKVAVAHKYTTEMRWMVEAWIEGLRLPVRPSQTRLLIEQQPFASSRVSRLGATYMANRALTLSDQTVEAQLIRPRLRLPTDREVFDALGKEAGLALSLSDKGHYEREFIRIVGGLDAVGRQLRHGPVVRTLWRFIDKAPNKKGVFDEGVLIGDRRYLDLRAIAKLWNGDEDAARMLAEKYLQSGLFQRGFFIKCPHCRQADWYRLAELSDKVVCHRCSREHVFAADAPVCFRLDEIAAQVIEHNSHVALLTLDRLRRGPQAFLYSTGCEVRREGKDEGLPWLEVDMLAVVDGDLVLGECKKGGTLTKLTKAQFGKYVELCKRLRPDRFVAATDASAWGQGSAEFLDNLQSRLAGMDVELVRLTGVDIGWPPAVGDRPVDVHLDQVLSGALEDDLLDDEG